MTLKLLKWFGPPVAALLVALTVYAFGYNEGVDVTQSKWDAAKQTQQREDARIEGEIAQREREHAQDVSDLQTQLNEADTVMELRIADISASYSQRLHLSEARAARYQQMAATDPAQCRSLASHATELDRTLEQGRSLVQELGATLEQRESQIKVLGAQILADRKLMDNPND